MLTNLRQRPIRKVVRMNIVVKLVVVDVADVVEMSRMSANADEADEEEEEVHTDENDGYEGGNWYTAERVNLFAFMIKLFLDGSRFSIE